MKMHFIPNFDEAVRYLLGVICMIFLVKKLFFLRAERSEKDKNHTKLAITRKGLKLFMEQQQRQTT